MSLPEGGLFPFMQRIAGPRGHNPARYDGQELRRRCAGPQRPPNGVLGIVWPSAASQAAVP